MDLSIIFVNYKTAQLLLDCIDSIYTQTKTLSVEIIVVDNFSQDDSKQIVTRKFPAVKWIDMPYNAGFARANNAGIKVATGEFILILNTDTIILDGALDKAVALFKAEKEAIACGVQLLNTDGSHQISGAHFIKGGLNFLLPLPYLGNFVRYWGYRLKSTVPSITSVNDKLEVDWIVGAFILTRTATAQQILLDEDFFMYAEEIEWCSRLRKQGKLFLYEAPKVIHLGGATSGSFYNTEENDNSKNLWNKKGRQILISMMLRIRKQYGAMWFLLMLVVFIVEIPIFALGLFIEKLAGKRTKLYWSSFASYCNNIFVLLKLTRKIISNKPHFYKV
ncbi:glycosyltransferase family 2 protein [Parasediminibacterium paludis]|uniref:Glycosyltransferase family 2 protein n=1 Tax=Parasediminibacterium paludis TaxID=908966 RepID=A0ABV8PU52_9BACT